jgi:uncharacterized membrane protein (DUF4010 family)
MEGRVMGDQASTTETQDRSIRNDRGAQIVFGTAPWLVILAVVLGVLGFAFGVIALINTASISSIAADAARAVAKAETATARSNVAEIYSKQLFTEMNRLGYPILTPAEHHFPQEPETP